MRETPFFLFTDFGAESIYTGQMRAVISSICPDADVMTLTNTVPRQNLVAAAFLLSSSLDYLPAGSHVLCVVDPGVGSERPIICLRTDEPELTLLGPDNGMFSVLSDRIVVCREVSDTSYWLEKISNTFHGRDIMAPTLAHLAAGTPLEEIGPRYESLEPLDENEWFSVEENEETLTGTILYADVFGNLITGISEQDVRRFFEDPDLNQLHVTVGDHEITGIHSSYNAVKAGDPLAIISSAGQLELAVNQGSAVEHFVNGPGDSVSVRRPG